MQLRGLLTVFLVPCLAPPQDSGEHRGTFDEVLAHHSADDLRQWREHHPWSLGDRLAEFLQGLLAVRRAGERIAIEKADVQASFFAETIAQDPMSGWVAGFLQWDMEACARQETAAEAMKLLPQMIAGGEGDAAWAQIEEFRGLVREGGWPLLGPDLARCAATYLHAGDRARAKTIATELAGSSEGLLQGVVLAASERILGEIARLEGNVGEAAQRTAHAFEVGSKLDSGPAAELLESIEGLAACDIDTLVELAVGQQETMLVIVGGKGRVARKLPFGDQGLGELILRDRDPAGSRALCDALFGTDTALFGRKLGIVGGGALVEQSLEGIVLEIGSKDHPPTFLGQDHSIVRLDRPPLGAATSVTTPPQAKPGWLVIQEGQGDPPDLGPGEVRIRGIHAAPAAEIPKAAVGCPWIFVDVASRSFPAEAMRGWKLDSDLAVLVDWTEPLVLAFHSAGVRDVLVSLRHGPLGEGRSFLLDVCGRVTRGDPLPEAMLKARSEWIARGSSRDAWAFWTIRRRS
jgi:hypothetical protein